MKLGGDRNLGFWGSKQGMGLHLNLILVAGIVLVNGYEITFGMSKETMTLLLLKLIMNQTIGGRGVKKGQSWFNYFWKKMLNP